MMLSSRILLNQQQIETINWKNLKPETNLIDLLQEEMEVSQEQLKSLFQLDQLEREQRYTKDGFIYDAAFYSLLKKRMVDGLPNERRQVQYAVAVQNTQMRAYPTMASSYRFDEIGELDRFAVSVLKLGEPVLLYCQDFSKRWCYVRSMQSDGWVLHDTLALEPDFYRWQQYYYNREQLIVADSRRTVQYIDYYGIPREQTLLMGTRLSLYDATYHSFILGLPVKDRFGNLATLQIMIPRDGGLIPGWMPLSSQNIISQAEKMLGEPYGWGGSGFYRDCTSLIGDVYSVFGLCIPRNSRQQMQMFGIEQCPENSEQKCQLIRSLLPGSILYFPGHAMLYLGQSDTKLEILHSVYAIGLQAKERLIPHKIRRVVRGTLNQMRVNGETFLDAITAIWRPDRQKEFLKAPMREQT